MRYTLGLWLSYRGIITSTPSDFFYLRGDSRSGWVGKKLERWRYSGKWCLKRLGAMYKDSRLYRLQSTTAPTACCLALSAPPILFALPALSPLLYEVTVISVTILPISHLCWYFPIFPSPAFSLIKKMPLLLKWKISTLFVLFSTNLVLFLRLIDEISIACLCKLFRERRGLGDVSTLRGGRI